MAKVLGRVTSINVRKLLWALDEIGETYEREDWGLPLRDPQVPEFLSLNPNGQVPVFIEDEGFALWESNGILVYLAQTRSGLLPKEKRPMGRALQWLSWQVSELNPAWAYAVQALVRKRPGFDDPARIAESVKAWTARMEILEGELERGEPYLAGAEFSIADIAMGLSLHRWYRAPIERKALPACETYYQRLRQRPAGARWMPDDMV
jgi:glutathione S-transferase